MGAMVTKQLLHTVTVYSISKISWLSDFFTACSVKLSISLVQVSSSHNTQIQSHKHVHIIQAYSALQTSLNYRAKKNGLRFHSLEIFSDIYL